MVTQSDIAQSQIVENKERNNQAEFELQQMGTAAATPKKEGAVQSEYVIFKLVKHRNGKVHVDGIDDNIPHPQTKVRQRIYLLSGAHSIWSTELADLFKTDPNYVRMNRMSLTFIDGVIRIKRDDERKLEFARVCSHCIQDPSKRSGSKFEFFEYDAAEVAKARLEKEDFELKMVVEASQVPAEQMKKHALYLGISLLDTEIGLPKSDAALRFDYIKAAKADPKRFHGSLNSKEVEVRYLIRQAIQDMLIDISSSNVKWSAGGEICKLPASHKPLDYLTELAMTNSNDGKRFLQQLQKTAK